MATSLPNQRSGLRKGRLKIVVAIDFGTTYSGIAYANTDEAEKEAKKGVKLHEWFKLGLCPEYEKRRATASELIRKYRSSTALPTLNTISNYEQLVVDYLKSLKGHLDEQLASVYKLVKQLPREHIITVPAIWDHKEQDRTCECAEQAGMGKGSRLHIISEPEAAAIWALDTIPTLGLKIGDTFIICDAGGGMANCRGGWDQKWLRFALSNFEETIKVRFTGEDHEEYPIFMSTLKESKSHGIINGSLILGSKS
ncbi:hypothetical protein TruAng_007691 [Truncatella angustata]|nr:hypothetical protein TruAng_007691 [Truncatella angustata]